MFHDVRIDGFPLFSSNSLILRYSRRNGGSRRRGAHCELHWKLYNERRTASRFSQWVRREEKRETFAWSGKRRRQRQRESGGDAGMRNRAGARGGGKSVPAWLMSRGMIDSPIRATRPGPYAFARSLVHSQLLLVAFSHARVAPLSPFGAVQSSFPIHELSERPWQQHSINIAYKRFYRARRNRRAPPSRLRSIQTPYSFVSSNSRTELSPFVASSPRAFVFGERCWRFDSVIGSRSRYASSRCAKLCENDVDYFTRLDAKGVRRCVYYIAKGAREKMRES